MTGIRHKIPMLDVFEIYYANGRTELETALHNCSLDELHCICQFTGERSKYWKHLDPAGLIAFIAQKVEDTATRSNAFALPEHQIRRR